MTLDFVLQLDHIVHMFTLLFVGSDTIDYSHYPNKEYQLEWLRMYLKEIAKIKGNLLKSQTHFIPLRPA